MTKQTTTWDVWVATDMTSFVSARQALDYYRRKVDQRGEELVSVERDGWRALDACRAEAEREAEREDAAREAREQR